MAAVETVAVTAEVMAAETVAQVAAVATETAINFRNSKYSQVLRLWRGTFF
jgi:hypothetical protein